MIDNRCCGRVKVVITRRVAQSHAGAGFPTSMSMPAFQRDGLPTANVGLLPTFYWPDASGTLTAVVDSKSSTLGEVCFRATLWLRSWTTS